MGRISNYQEDLVPSLSDKLIGTETNADDATKNYTISSILELKQIAASPVLFATDYTSQAPSVLDVPLQVLFGAAQNIVTDPVMLDVSGNITFNQAGLYLFSGYASFERQGSSGGVSVVLFRALINGVQSGITKSVSLSGTGIAIPYELTTPIQANAGDVLTWEIMRDSSGVNQGGLYTHTTGSSWSNVPSVSLSIQKLG
tara:strand:+ start:2101 stop:2700 length:600 start_codon:yes stop_codon:yes gene_type:complete